jgi:DNA-binding response OmpR family regulator
MTDKKIKVLLVEDDAMIIDMYLMRFQEEGYEVFHTDKGSEALEIAEHQKPDIALLDVMLPEIDGFTILRELKSNDKTKNIPVLMLTNLGQESDQDKGEELGAEGYFIKAQHTPTEIMEKIKGIINK